MDRFEACFSEIEDPRTGNARRHDLLEVLFMSLCASLCGAESCVDMADFAQAKEDVLRGFLKLAGGPPSHDPFSRVFGLLDPAQFHAAFQRFMTALALLYHRCGSLWPVILAHGAFNGIMVIALYAALAAGLELPS